MIFFIFGANRSLGKTIESSYGPCLNRSCQGGTVDLVEVSHHLSLFFIPVWTFRGKEVVHCRECGYLVNKSVYQHQKLDVERTVGLPPMPKKCQVCEAQLQRRFRFCPNCGVMTEYQEGTSK
uniref:Zinc-ribbon 15 domain-containing protein n=1 Tax=Helicotheca tamesis TaxID=374047 RepID=A0A7S2MKI3_9STRA|mmetsp:Transcript_17461/g.24080  ORF Transcript_17461/g.24080 Transcript_17461/m.24080 type:complete len:122 (+) Transcript_17461:80-445(+)